MNDSEERGASYTNDDPDKDSLEEMHRSAEKQLESLHKLNDSFLLKAKKYETQASVLISENEFLVQRNLELVTQVHCALDTVRNLSMVDARLRTIESNYGETTANISGLKQVVKQMESRISVVIAEQSAFHSEFMTLNERVVNLHRNLEVAVSSMNFGISERARTSQRVAYPAMIGSRVDYAAKAKYSEDDGRCRCEIEESNRQPIRTSMKRKGSSDGSQRNIENIEAKSAYLRSMYNSVSGEYDMVEKMRSGALEEKSKLERRIGVLRNEREELQKNLRKNDADISFINSAIRVALKERNSVDKELNSKEGEARKLIAEIAAFQEKQGELIHQCNELEVLDRSARKDVDATKKELEVRKRLTDVIVAERNLLETEKACIEKDFSNARNRSMFLERTKGQLRRRVLELEATKLKLSKNIEALEQDRQSTIITHNEEMHNRLAEKLANIKRQTNTLYEELLSVLNRHAENNNHKNLEEDISTSVASAVAENEDIDDIEDGNLKAESSATREKLTYSERE